MTVQIGKPTSRLRKMLSVTVTDSLSILAAKSCHNLSSILTAKRCPIHSHKLQTDTHTQTYCRYYFYAIVYHRVTHLSYISRSSAHKYIYAVTKININPGRVLGIRQVITTVRKVRRTARGSFDCTPVRDVADIDTAATGSSSIERKQKMANGRARRTPTMPLGRNGVPEYVRVFVHVCVSVCPWIVWYVREQTSAECDGEETNTFIYAHAHIHTHLVDAVEY